MRSLSKSFDSFLVAVFIISLIILQFTLVSAQTSSTTSFPATQWQKLYGSGNTQLVSNLIQTSDGGYAFLDCAKFYQTFFTPAILYKLDSLGNMQWNKTIKSFTASNLIQTSDGGYEISGQWSTYGTTYVDTPAVIKTDSKGNMQWYENTITVLDLAIASSNIQTSDGGFAYFEPANSNVFPTVTSFPTLVKTNPNNNTQWIENFPYPIPSNYYNGTITFPFKIFSIIETSDGALACLGIADPYLQPQGLWGPIYLMKTAAFLPLPSQSPLSTPLPSPTPAPNIITVNEQILIIALLAVVVASSIVLLIYRRHRKTARSGSQETLTNFS